MQDAGYGPFNRLTLTYLTPGQSGSQKAGGGVPGNGDGQNPCRPSDWSPADNAWVLSGPCARKTIKLGYTSWLAGFSGDALQLFVDLLRSDSAGNYAGYPQRP
jgi:hypothetical protein